MLLLWRQRISVLSRTWLPINLTSQCHSCGILRTPLAMTGVARRVVEQFGHPFDENWQTNLRNHLPLPWLPPRTSFFHLFEPFSNISKKSQPWFGPCCKVAIAQRKHASWGWIVGTVMLEMTSKFSCMCDLIISQLRIRCYIHYIPAIIMIITCILKIAGKSSLAWTNGVNLWKKIGTAAIWQHSMITYYIYTLYSI